MIRSKSLSQKHDAPWASRPAVPPAVLRTLSPLVRATITWNAGSGQASAVRGSLAGTLAADVALLLRNRLSPVLLQMLEAGNDVGIPESEVPALARHATMVISHARAVEAAAGPALEALGRAGVDLLVMKGPAVARFHTPPRARPFSDIDLLVPPEQFRRALHVLGRLGYSRPAATVQPWPWFDRVCIEGLNLSAGAFEAIDLHHHVAPWALTRQFSAHALLDRAEGAEISGARVRVPSPGDCIVIALLHVVNDLWKGDPSLLSWRDAAVLSAMLGPDGIDRSFDAAGLGWMADIIRAVLGDVLTLQPAGGVRPDHQARRHWRRLEALGWSADTFAARHPIGWVARLPALRGLAYVAGHAVPSPAYARGKHGGYLRYWSASVQSFREALRGIDYRRTPLPGALHTREKDVVEG